MDIFDGFLLLFFGLAVWTAILFGVITTIAIHWFFKKPFKSNLIYWLFFIFLTPVFIAGCIMLT
ncbi:MAG: hypothetical protein KBD55_03175 [Candidatus Pacebacteria bacterium]|jgi:hypothetical protein|nr:hypothetical protein [Candidatus Paceibacterota bacterium]